MPQACVLAAFRVLAASRYGAAPVEAPRLLGAKARSKGMCCYGNDYAGYAGTETHFQRQPCNVDDAKVPPRRVSPRRGIRSVR